MCTNQINQIILNEMQVFWGEGKTGVPREKPLRAEKRTNKLNPHVTPSLEIEPGPHWWEASALTTMPRPLSKKMVSGGLSHFSETKENEPKV